MFEVIVLPGAGSGRVKALFVKTDPFIEIQTVSGLLWNQSLIVMYY